MTPEEEWEREHAELVRNSDEYRAKHASWKGAYYAGCLSVCGIALAISPLLKKESTASTALAGILSLTCIVSCICCLWNMRLFIRLYDSLGYDEIPDTPDQLPAYYQRRLESDRRFREIARFRKAADRLLEACLVCGAVVLVLMLFV